MGCQEGVALLAHRLTSTSCNYAIDQKFGHIHVVHASRTAVCQDINPATSSSRVWR